MAPWSQWTGGRDRAVVAKVWGGVALCFVFSGQKKFLFICLVGGGDGVEARKEGLVDVVEDRDVCGDGFGGVTPATIQENGKDWRETILCSCGCSPQGYGPCRRTRA